MPSLPIFTALNVPTVTSHPSVTCLQWSGDGQAAILTKGAVYILVDFDKFQIPLITDLLLSDPRSWYKL